MIKAKQNILYVPYCLVSYQISTVTEAHSMAEDISDEQRKTFLLNLTSLETKSAAIQLHTIKII
jgi:hypothetical protein